MGQTLVLVEKEDAGERIAQHLQCKPSEGYWANAKYIVVAARGHLLDMWLRGLNVHNIDELPATELYYRILKRDKPKMSLIESLARQCSAVIVATDFDREGEVIGYNIAQYIWKLSAPSKITRAYYSALTESELGRAFANLRSMDEALLAQGMARNLADVIIGLNLTKAVTLLFKEKHSQLTQAISIGRVQSPLLSAIKRSVGVSYKAEAEISADDETSETVYITAEEEDIEVPISPPQNETVELISYDEETSDTNQAEPFPNTSEVQTELPFNPEISMSICESLYLKGYMTYPRTKSHYLPEETIEGLERVMKTHSYMPESFSAEYAESAEEESKLPHWAITLTEEGIEALARGAIKGREKIVANYLITKIAKAMAPPLQVTTRYALLNIDGKQRTIEWSAECENPEDCIHPYESFSEKPIIDPGVYKVKIVKLRERKLSITTEAFQPTFSVFSNKDLVNWMEQKGLGTEATRHIFPVVLRARNYVDKENLPNQLGETVASIIGSMGLSSELTAEMENKIETLEKLSDLEPFKAWILETTKTLLNKLDFVNNSMADMTGFRCPNDHEAILINTRHGLFLRCETCKKFYSL